MNNDAKNLERVALEITEARQWGIEIHSPDVNTSGVSFSGAHGHIWYGLACIKNVSEELGHAIVSEREENGAFESLEDFLSRLGPQHMNRKKLEALITAGALDSLHARQPLLEHLDSVLEYVKAQKKSTVPENQNALFASLTTEQSSLEIPDSSLSAAEQAHKNLEQERLSLGLFLSAHPFDEYEDLLSELEVPSIADNKRSNRTTNLTVGGILTGLKPITTKNGDHMAFAEVEDKGERAEVLIFPDMYGQKKDRLQDGACLLIKSKLSTKDGERKFLAQDIKTPTEEDAESLRDWIRRKPQPVGRSTAQDLTPGNGEHDASNGSYTNDGEEIVGINIPVRPPVTQSKLQAIKEVLLKASRGSCPVYLIISGGNYDTRCVETRVSVSYSPQLIEDIKAVLHAEEGSSNYEEGHEEEFQSSPG